MARKTQTTTTTVRKKGDVETVATEETEGGMTMEDGVVLTTTIALIGAIVLAYFAVQGMPGPMPG